MGPRLLHWLLRLLPAEFRDGYAREIELTVSAEAREAGRARALRIWLGTALDVLAAAPAQHADILWRDLSVGVRGLLARPAHALTAVVTLAIGIGANVAMFAVIDAVLLAPLDYRDAGRLVAVSETRQGGSPANLGYLSFVDLSSRARTVTELVAASQSTATFDADGQDALRVNAMRVSRNYFDLIGVQPVLGRAFTSAEDRPGAARQVLVLSDGLWRRRFAADPRVVGRVVAIAGEPFTIVGVMPRGFDDLLATRFYHDAAVWFPLGYDPAASFACRTCRHLRVFGRLAPGVSPAVAEAELTAVFQDLERAHPAEYTSAGAQVRTIGDVLLGPVRPALWLLWAGVALLLVIACANVASLLLMRGSDRASEVAVRTALGVTRARLARQLVTESLVLSVAGAVAGLAPAWAAVRLIGAYGPLELPRLTSIALDARAVAVAVLLAAVSGALFAVAPTRRLLRRNAAVDLAGSGRHTASLATWRARAGLVTANVAMAAMLLAGAGLLVRSVNRLLLVEPGFSPEGVLTLRLWAGGPRFSAGTAEEQVATATRFYDAVLAETRAVPGVLSAAAVTTLPLGGGVDGYGLHIVGRPTANPEDAPTADRFVVTPDYFATLRIPLAAGRLLEARDSQQAAPTAVISQFAATMLFPGEDPIGRQVVLGGPDGPPRTIVGVVGDVRHHGLDRALRPQVYVAQAQWAWAETLMTLVVRTSGDPAALAPTLRAVVRDVDAGQPVTDIRPYADVVASTTSTRRFVAGTLGVFASLALLLAVVGLYGALSVNVAQRRIEIGIRLAMGADPRQVRRLVLRHGLGPVALGLALGAAGALVAARLFGGQLVDGPAVDPVAVGSALVVLLAASLAACAIPAARAARIDPATSLRAS
ncbi:MAG: ABC transporter permease [Acidobacteria bacterium]|nr:ABC transporter permease [Acidobacteriota bacterium]